MDTVTLKQTSLDVSRICFGTMTFGGQTDFESAGRMIDLCADSGINFLDTANVYNIGASEEMLGRLLEGRRQHFILASKVRNKMGDGVDMAGLSRGAIFRAIDDSLRRLNTDYLDLYYLHLPDYAVPIEESLDTMNELVRQGKVRYLASSNYSGWQMVEMLWIAGRKGEQPPYVAQPMYNLIARGIEQEYLPMSKRFGISNVVYNPLAGGLLTGKQRRDAPLPGTRFDNNRMYLDRYWHQADFDAVDQLQRIAASAGRSLVSLALNWIYHHTPVECIILGASRLDHLEQNLKVLSDGPLDPETLQGCDKVWEALRGPTPKYNR
ncbi:MAG TPA: aldo/keto reductase [Bryobacteraceae bacterium]|jgi:aryl-alcohol dehydrogenase-like predicted oxidoreductase|nr:aldo/keto reductase [Bryobacteraceae bacterium]